MKILKLYLIEIGKLIMRKSEIKIENRMRFPVCGKKLKINVIRDQ